MATFPASHRDLLESQVGILTTFGPDSYPQATAVWFLLDGDEIKLSLNTARQKVKNLRRRPECTFFLMDLANPYRTMEIRAMQKSARTRTMPSRIAWAANTGAICGRAISRESSGSS